MPRELTADDAVKIATHIVKSWENIEAMADKRIADGTIKPSMRMVYIEMLRDVAGGEEMYQVSKAFLAEQRK